MSKTLFKLSGPDGATFEVVDNSGTCEVHSGGTKVIGAQGSAIAGLTDSSGGTASDTIAAIGATYDQAEVRNAVASLAAKIEEILTALETQGTIATRYVTDYFNGFELPGSTYSGGPTVVADNDGTLVTSPADTLPIEGMRLATTVADGAVLGPEMVVNGDFSSENISYLNNHADTTSIVVNGELICTSDKDDFEYAGTVIPLATVVGKKYRILATARNITTTCVSIRALAGETTSATILAESEYFYDTAEHNITLVFVATTTTSGVYLRGISTPALKDAQAGFDNVSVREVIPTWLPTDASGDPIHTSTPLRTRKGTVSVYDESYKGPLIEPARTNLALQSNSFDVTTGGWGPATGLVFDGNVTSILPGVSAQKFTNDGTGGSRNRSQIIGTLNGATHTLWFIVENVDSAETELGIYNNTTSSFVVLGRLTWATEAATVTAGSGTIFSEKLTDTGPNGGKVFLIGVAGAVASGDTGSIFIYPQGIGTSTKSLIIHHGQFEAGAAFPSTPILTTTTTVTRPAANLTRPTARTALAALNNWATLVRFRPTAAGQTAVLWGSYTDADNATRLDLAPTTLTYTKRLAGADHVAQTSLTHAADTLYEALLYQHSVHGMGIAVRSWNGSAWSAFGTWGELTDADGIANAPIASTYQIGARNNANHFAGNYPFTEIIQLSPNLHPQTQLADLLNRGRI